MRISDWSSDVCSSDLRSAPSNRRSGAGHHGTTITRFSQVMASASDTDRQQVCQNSASSPARPSSPKRLRRWKAKTSCRPASQACQRRSEEHTSELQSLMRIAYAVFRLKKKKRTDSNDNTRRKLHS